MKCVTFDLDRCSSYIFQETKAAYKTLGEDPIYINTLCMYRTGSVCTGQLVVANSGGMDVQGTTTLEFEHLDV